jgi:non-specific serine/threonine protein kinase
MNSVESSSVLAEAASLQLTPRGHLLLASDEDTPALPADLQQGLMAAFALGSGHGLFYLGATQVGTVLPPVLAWWRDFAARFVTAVCGLGECAEISVMAPDTAVLDALIADAPPMRGAEYLTAELLATLWSETSDACNAELAAAKLPLADFLKSRHPAWNLVGRVYFNLAENRKDSEAPFAFLVTYTSRLSASGKAQHLPLSKALSEFSDGKSQMQLLSLLKPVQAAAAQCPWLHEMVEAAEIYYPLRWTPLQAYQFLTDVPKLEAAGILVRAPQSWGAVRPARPMVKASVGERPPSLLGVDSMLDFSMEVTLEGETLTASELKALLQGSDGLQLIRGRWVEVDRSRLKRMLARFEGIEQAAQAGGLEFSQAMRLLAGASLEDDIDPIDADWSQLVAGPWLAQTLQGLRQPQGLAQVSPGSQLKATLRPYQEAGVRWLYLLTRLGLGACLADDMGLGKTIQVLALLLVLKQEQQKALRANLLVAPASLLANWSMEAERFAPSLRVLIVHPSAMPSAQWRVLDAQGLAKVDLVITSYGALLRLPVLLAQDWRVVVIDEAQAIKNPGAKQTRQVKLLKAETRIALTGTPVENRLSDLWSIFDFTNPGLLGSGKVFGNFAKRLAKAEHFGPLRKLVQPYILRRLKTDKRVIDDLPDKTELKAWCHLSPAQAALYQRAVEEMAMALEDVEGIGRKGLVLSYLMRFKQICNHPSQWLGDGAWASTDSGKFARLRELVEVIAARQDKLLVFTQFRETTEPLAAFLGSIFGRDGLVLHGGTPVARRRELVKQFQDDDLTPFFVLSLKAGGAGLNLTAASHVIHFDRWWNPAVENQATDRAFRIGQKKNVLVHKFVCRGTVEERIDALIESKQQLVKDVLDGSAELLLTEMSDRELLDLVKLDIHTAQESDDAT